MIDDDLSKLSVEILKYPYWRCYIRISYWDYQTSRLKMIHQILLSGFSFFRLKMCYQARMWRLSYIQIKDVLLESEFEILKFPVWKRFISNRSSKFSNIIRLKIFFQTLLLRFWNILIEICYLAQLFPDKLIITYIIITSHQTRLLKFCNFWLGC